MNKDKNRRRIYSSLLDANQRCHNPKHTWYDSYGGRGIFVCEEWRLIPNPKNQDNDITQLNKKIIDKFVEWSLKNGYCTNLELDRVDNDGPYSPENCRWVTETIGSINTRKKIGKSKFRCVCWHSQNNNWVVSIRIQGKKTHIGSFKTEIEAAIAYNNYVNIHNLPHTLNIIG